MVLVVQKQEMQLEFAAVENIATTDEVRSARLEETRCENARCQKRHCSGCVGEARVKRWKDARSVAVECKQRQCSGVSQTEKDAVNNTTRKPQ